MIYPNYKPKDRRRQLTAPRGRQLTLDEITPDFGRYPWAGILRCLYWANRRDLHHLAALAADQFAKEAKGWRR